MFHNEMRSMLLRNDVKHDKLPVGLLSRNICHEAFNVLQFSSLLNFFTQNQDKQPVSMKLLYSQIFPIDEMKIRWENLNYKTSVKQPFLVILTT